jgi:plastocyanin
VTRLALAALAALALLLAGCGSSSHAPAMMAADASATTHATPVVAAHPGHVTVAITNFAFKPAKLTVAVGTRVTFVNHDSTAHTATADHGGFGTGTINPHHSDTVRLTKPGRYPYHCLFHAFMTGTITVTKG